MAKNRNLSAARTRRKDEYYTRLTDVEKELRHYKEQFRGKVVYCNCDEPTVSAFFQYFENNFERFGLRRLIATCYRSQQYDAFSKEDSDREWGICTKTSRGIRHKALTGDGDFRSPECVELLKQADIVATNPPFSLIREFIAQLVEYQKQFIVLGPLSAATSKDLFPFFMADRVWFGNCRDDIEFSVPPGHHLKSSRWRKDSDGNEWFSMGNVRWFTNMEYKGRQDELLLYKRHSPAEFPQYDNFDAIEVSKTEDIPESYKGVMGVPTTFLDRYAPRQFEIVGITNINGLHGGVWNGSGGRMPTVGGKRVYQRLLIRWRRAA